MKESVSVKPLPLKELKISSNENHFSHSESHYKQISVSSVNQLKLQQTIISLKQQHHSLKIRTAILEEQNKRLAQQLSQSNEQKQNERQEKQSIILGIKQLSDSKKKLEEWLNTTNNNYSILQKKYQTVCKENNLLKEKVDELNDKYTSIMKRKYTSQMNINSREKQLQGLIQNSDDQLKASKDKIRQLSNLINSNNTTIQNLKKDKERLSKQLQIKDEQASVLIKKQKQLEHIIEQRQSQSQQLYSSLEQLKTSIQSKDDQLLKCQSLFKTLLSQFQLLVERNEELQKTVQMNEVDLQTINRFQNKVDEVFNEVMTLLGRVKSWNRGIGDQLCKHIVFLRDQYHNLQKMYDRMLIKVVQSTHRSKSSE